VDPKKVKYKKLTYKAEGAKPKIMRGFGHEDANGKKTKNVIKATSGYSSIWNHIKEQEIREIITTSVGTNHKIFDVVKSIHPSVMSALLPVCPILMTTEEGELVFDPFSGTNSVGHISQLLNRRTLSTEWSSLYFKDGCDNLQNGVEGFNADALKRINEIAFGQDETDLNTAA
jgi:DNA modification methylase